MYLPPEFMHFIDCNKCFANLPETKQLKNTSELGLCVRHLPCNDEVDSRTVLGPSACA